MASNECQLSKYSEADHIEPLSGSSAMVPHLLDGAISSVGQHPDGSTRPSPYQQQTVQINLVAWRKVVSNEGNQPRSIILDFNSTNKISPFLRFLLSALWKSATLQSDFGLDWIVFSRIPTSSGVKHQNTFSRCGHDCRAREEVERRPSKRPSAYATRHVVQDVSVCDVQIRLGMV
jgi:hypothetical protein